MSWSQPSVQWTPLERLGGRGSRQGEQGISRELLEQGSLGTYGTEPRPHWTAQAWAVGVDDSGHPCLHCPQADPTILVVTFPSGVGAPLGSRSVSGEGLGRGFLGSRVDTETELLPPRGNLEDKAVPLVSLLNKPSCTQFRPGFGDRWNGSQITGLGGGVKGRASSRAPKQQ